MAMVVASVVGAIEAAAVAGFVTTVSISSVVTANSSN